MHCITLSRYRGRHLRPLYAHGEQHWDELPANRRLAVAAHAALWDGWRAEGLRIECKSALSMYKEHPEVREWMD